MFTAVKEVADQPYDEPNYESFPVGSTRLREQITASEQTQERD